MDEDFKETHRPRGWRLRQESERIDLDLYQRPQQGHRLVTALKFSSVLVIAQLKNASGHLNAP